MQIAESRRVLELLHHQGWSIRFGDANGIDCSRTVLLFWLRAEAEKMTAEKDSCGSLQARDLAPFISQRVNSIENNFRNCKSESVELSLAGLKHSCKRTANTTANTLCAELLDAL